MNMRDTLAKGELRTSVMHNTRRLVLSNVSLLPQMDTLLPESILFADTLDPFSHSTVF